MKKTISPHHKFELSLIFGSDSKMRRVGLEDLELLLLCVSATVKDSLLILKDFVPPHQVLLLVWINYSIVGAGNGLKIIKAMKATQSQTRMEDYDVALQSKRAHRVFFWRANTSFHILLSFAVTQLSNATMRKLLSDAKVSAKEWLG